MQILEEEIALMIYVALVTLSYKFSTIQKPTILPCSAVIGSGTGNFISE
jgi:hypothetical protein